MPELGFSHPDCEHWSDPMAANLTFRYDKVGDILYIDRVKPYAAQPQTEPGDEVSARLNPETGMSKR
jgi:hypothetical protein